MDPRSTNREGTPVAGRSGKHRVRAAFSRVFHVYRRLWFRVLAVGFLFIALLEISYLAYPNPNLVPAIIVYCAFLGTYRSLGVGVMIGLVSAMAFSALETSGYAFNAFLGTLDGNTTGRVADLFKSPLNVVLLDGSVLFRSLLDPLGHGTWTMLICFGLWNERRKAGRAVFNSRVLGSFVLAMLLHSSWDTVLSFPSGPLWGRVLAWFAFAMTAGFTLWLMERIIRRTREAVSKESEESPAGPLSPTG